MSVQPVQTAAASTAAVRPATNGRRRLHDLHDARVARQLRADRPFRRAAGLHAVQRRHASGRARERRAPLRLPPPQASLQRQVHARRRPLRADLLCPVDDHGRGARPQIPGNRRSPVLRRAGRRDAAGRCAGIPARRRRAEDAAGRSRPGRSSAVRAGQGTRHPRALRAHRVHRRHQRRQRRTVGHRHRHRRRQSRVLGHRRRADGLAEDRRVRRRIRHVRRPRAGTEDPGHRAADRQAAPGLLLRQQRRHRRCADRRRGAQQVRRLPAARPMDVVRMERVLDTRRPRLRRRSWAC